MAERRRPALQQYVEKVVGGNYVTAMSDVAVTTAATKLIDNNMERMSLTFINVGAEEVLLAPKQGVTTTSGIVLGPLGGNLNLNAVEDLVLVGYDWWAIGNGGSSTVTVIAVTRYGDGAL